MKDANTVINNTGSNKGLYKLPWCSFEIVNILFDRNGQGRTTEPIKLFHTTSSCNSLVAKLQVVGTRDNMLEVT